MIREQGVVVSLDDGSVWVSIQRHNTCQSCSAKSFCGTSVIAKLMGGEPRKIKVPNTINAAIGERVLITIPETHLLKSALFVYMLPLLAMLLGAVLLDSGFSGWPVGEFASVLGGVLGLLVGFMTVSYCAHRVQKPPKLGLAITSVNTSQQ